MPQVLTAAAAQMMLLAKRMIEMKKTGPVIVPFPRKYAFFLESQFGELVLVLLVFCLGQEERHLFG